MPTKYHRSRLFTVGNAHPTSAIVYLTDGEFQILDETKERLDFCQYRNKILTNTLKSTHLLKSSFLITQRSLRTLR